MRKRAGFTLLEIILVIVIISIIFTAMGISISSLQNEARVSVVNADLKELQLAIESYYKNYMYEFPPMLDYQRILLDATPRILNRNLIDPFGDTPASLYVYALSPNETYYVIYSLGVRRRGRAAVSDDGDLMTSGNPILITNGRL